MPLASRRLKRETTGKAASCYIEREGLSEASSSDLLICGRSLHARASTSSILGQAHQVFERALALDPNSISAKVGIGFALCTKVANYWSTSVQLDLARAEALLLAAIEHEPNEPRARSALGLLRRLQNRLDDSIVELHKAVALDPYFAPSFWFLGTTLALRGQPDIAIAELQKGLQLTASGEAAPYAHAVLALAYLLSDNVEQGVEFARKARTDNPSFYFTRMYLAAGLGLKGEIEDAKVELAAAIKIRPELNSLSKWRTYCSCGSSQYWKMHHHTIAVGLQRAGMPDI
jgi:adenylate cyclase